MVYYQGAVSFYPFGLYLSSSTPNQNKTFLIRWRTSLCFSPPKLLSGTSVLREKVGQRLWHQQTNIVYHPPTSCSQVHCATSTARSNMIDLIFADTNPNSPVWVGSFPVASRGCFVVGSKSALPSLFASCTKLTHPVLNGNSHPPNYAAFTG